MFEWLLFGDTQLGSMEIADLGPVFELLVMTKGSP